MSKRKLYLIAILVTIPLLILIGYEITIKDGKTNLIVDKILYFDRNTETDDEHEIQQVKMFAISLNVQGEYDENVISSPLTCKINVDKMVRLIYIDDEEEIGSKYIEYNKPAGTLLQPTKKGYNFVKWTNEDEEEIDETSVIATNVDYYIYTNWDIITSDLIVDPNSGTWEGSTEQQKFELSYDDTKEIPNPTRTGYTFKGWALTGTDSTLDETTFTMGTGNATLKAQWENNPPEVKITNIRYTNSGASGLESEGSLRGGSETITVTIKATDVEDGTPTVSLRCRSGSLCSYLNQTNRSVSGNIITYTFRASNFGLGVIEVTAQDKVGEKATDDNLLIVYGADSSINRNERYTQTTFSSGELEIVEGCYISDFSFTVQFGSGHSNSSADPDIMTVEGKTASGKTVILYTWSGNMKGDKHTSNLNEFNKQSEKIVSISFYTYSPHDGCTPDATINYTVKYRFDRSLLN